MGRRAGECAASLYIVHTRPSCPRATMTHTRAAAVLILGVAATTHVDALPRDSYVQEAYSWAGNILPGNVDPNDSQAMPGFVKSPNVKDMRLHGTSVYAAWQATNNFVRYWHLNYGLFSYRGEPKHGLWKWTVPGAEIPFWWCDLGNFNEGLTSKGMAAIWQQLSKSANMIRPSEMVDPSDFLGKYAIDAKLDKVAIDIMKVDLSVAARAQVWEHKGHLNEIDFDPIPEYDSNFDVNKADVEMKDMDVYVFRAYYGWDDGNGTVVMLDKHNSTSAHPCSGTSDLEDAVCAASVHTFVAVVFKNGYDDVEGFTGYGIHYSGGTGCPARCGASACTCDGILIDLSFDTNLILSPDWSETVTYLPAQYPTTTGEELEPEAEAEAEAEEEEPGCRRLLEAQQKEKFTYKSLNFDDRL